MNTYSLLTVAALMLAQVSRPPTGYRPTLYARRLGATCDDEVRIRRAAEKRARKLARKGGVR